MRAQRPAARVYTAKHTHTHTHTPVWRCWAWISSLSLWFGLQSQYPGLSLQKTNQNGNADWLIKG